MFGFGKKKEVEADQNIYAPVDGEAVEITTVSDPVFAQKMMGEGFAVTPSGGDIVAPVAGTITVNQGHAVGIRRSDGLEVLIHIGIDTVSLKGAPFTQHVKIDDNVAGGDPLVTVDWQQIKDANLDPVVMVLITNSKDQLDQFTINYGDTKAGAELGLATAK
ncbi:PTS sugar transporter subunit IIA [Xylocopilactobacillus apis]|uniref:PTS sugar transporter subunit IIA n=1 Tax=Xylocopilactobacillus apis TaxID=2932183 RepID=A0AAU9CZ34_9LACO|nr:PTS glucose transporter subunit IIA [Xylocopilactobacillus apis]BDR55481.1 PTS sugar transporter subunit IIA [Xylocopilactobacillus apis]